MSLPTAPKSLFHYTDERGLSGILATKILDASTFVKRPNDIRYGNGQYLSDFQPGEKTLAQFSREFLGLPYLGRKFTHYIEINVEGLEIIEGRPGVFVVPNDKGLELSQRIIRWGAVPTTE